MAFMCMKAAVEDMCASAAAMWDSGEMMWEHDHSPKVESEGVNSCERERLQDDDDHAYSADGYDEDDGKDDEDEQEEAQEADARNEECEERDRPQLQIGKKMDDEVEAGAIATSEPEEPRLGARRLAKKGSWGEIETKKKLGRWNPCREKTGKASTWEIAPAGGSCTEPLVADKLCRPGNEQEAACAICIGSR